MPDPDALLDQAKTDDGVDSCSTTTGPLQVCATAPTCSDSPSIRKKVRRNATMAVDASNLVLRRFDPMLEERGLDDVLEYACSDWAEILCAPFEKIDQIREIICGLEEAYEAALQLRALIKCLTNPLLQPSNRYYYHHLSTCTTMDIHIRVEGI